MGHTLPSPPPPICALLCTFNGKTDGFICKPVVFFVIVFLEHGDDDYENPKLKKNELKDTLSSLFYDLNF